MTNSTSIFMHRIFKGIGDAIIRVFIPLLVYKATKSLLLCFLYALTNFLFIGLFFLVLKKFMQKFPLASIIIHIVPMMLAEVLLTLNLNIWIILLIALFDGMSIALYYGSLNLIFGFIDENENVAKFAAGKNIGVIIFTLLSAYILGSMNDSLVFMVILSIIFYSLSIIPFCCKYKELKNKIISPSEVNINEILKDNKYFSLYHYLSGIIFFFIEVFLPVYLYINGLSFSVVGILLALQYLVYILAGYFCKFMVARKKSYITLIIGMVLLFCMMICIIFIKNMYAIYIFSVVYFFANQLFHLTIFEIFTKDQMSKNYYYNSIFYRDVFLHFGKFSGAVVCLLSPIYLGVFLFTIISGLAMGFTGLKCCKTYNNSDVTKYNNDTVNNES